VINKHVLSYSTLVAENQNISVFSAATCVNKTLGLGKVKLQLNGAEN
jgi:hypothetical protein